MHRGLPDSEDEGASEGAAFSAATRPGWRTPAAIALAGIAVLVIALLTKQPTPPPSVPATSVAPRPSPAVAIASPAEPANAPTNVPTKAPTAEPTFAPPTRNPTATPHPTFLPVSAGAGATQLVPAGPTPVRLTVSLPDGWKKASDAVYVKSDDVARTGMSIGAWRLQHVFIVPCRWSTPEWADGPLMRSAEGLGEALSAWWGQEPGMLPYWNSKIAPLATRRQATTIQGYAAWHLEVLIPSGLDLSECDGGQLILWDTATGEVRNSQPGEIHRLWAVDVDGNLIVIDATSFLRTPSTEVAELQAVIDSIVIEP